MSIYTEFKAEHEDEGRREVLSVSLLTVGGVLD